MEPYEIIISPFTVWTGPVGETMPLIDAAPAGDWKKVGTSGDENYGEDGVTVTHEQTIQLIRTLGSTGPRKASRTEEGLLIGFTLMDLTLEEYAAVLNDNTVTDTAEQSGVAGFRDINLRRGLIVTEYALLIRGAVSPYGDGWNSQYQIPRAVLMSSPAPVFKKGDPAGLEFEFAALEDPDAATDAERFGKLVIQDADQGA